MLLTAQQRLALVALAALMAAVALARREPTKPPQVVLAPAASDEPKLQESTQGNALRDGQSLNPNHASAEELTLLPGIGPSLALRIVESRNQNGLFRTPADLRRVKGVGEKTLGKFKEFLRFDSEPVEHTTQSELALERAREVGRRLDE